MTTLKFGEKKRAAVTRPLVKHTTATVVKPTQTEKTVQPEKKAPEAEVESTRSSRRGWNELANARREEPRDTAFESETAEDPQEGSKKGGWFQRVKDRLTGAFEVVDDDFDNE